MRKGIWPARQRGRLGFGKGKNGEKESELERRKVSQKIEAKKNKINPPPTDSTGKVERKVRTILPALFVATNTF